MYSVRVVHTGIVLIGPGKVRALMVGNAPHASACHHALEKIPDHIPFIRFDYDRYDPSASDREVIKLEFVQDPLDHRDKAMGLVIPRGEEFRIVGDFTNHGVSADFRKPDGDEPAEPLESRYYHWIANINRGLKDRLYIDPQHLKNDPNPDYVSAFVDIPMGEMYPLTVRPGVWEFKTKPTDAPSHAQSIADGLVKDLTAVGDIVIQFRKYDEAWKEQKGLRLKAGKNLNLTIGNLPREKVFLTPKDKDPTNVIEHFLMYYDLLLPADAPRRIPHRRRGRSSVTPSQVDALFEHFFAKVAIDDEASAIRVARDALKMLLELRRSTEDSHSKPPELGGDDCPVHDPGPPPPP